MTDPGFPSVTSSFSEVIASKENMRTALRKEVAQLKKTLTEKANLVSILEATIQRSDKEQEFDDQADENEKVGKGQGRKERLSRKDTERDQDENEESTKADDEKGWASFGGPHLVRKRSWPSSKHEDGADVNPAEAKDTREDEDVVAELIPQHAPVFPETTFLLGAEPMYAFLYFSRLTQHLYCQIKVIEMQFRLIQIQTKKVRRCGIFVFSHFLSIVLERIWEEPLAQPQSLPDVRWPVIPRIEESRPIGLADYVMFSSSAHNIPLRVEERGKEKESEKETEKEKEKEDKGKGRAATPTTPVSQRKVNLHQASPGLNKQYDLKPPQHEKRMPSLFVFLIFFSLSYFLSF